MKKRVIIIKTKRVKLRNDWGKVKPFTRVEADKTKYNRKAKHTKKDGD